MTTNENIFGLDFTVLNGTYTISTGWSDDGANPRRIGDVNGDGLADIVGFGPNYVTVAAGHADGTFGAPVAAYSGAFTYNSGWTSQGQYTRTLADVNGDGRADIVAFGGNYVRVALGQANSTFAPDFIAYSTGFTATTGWGVQSTWPRWVDDVNGDGRADIVGFGGGNVYVALGQANGTFSNAYIALASAYGPAQGWTDQDTRLRVLGDVNGDGRADIIGFSQNAVVVSLGNANGTFSAGFTALNDSFTPSVSWITNTSTPRQVADVNGDGRDDIVGFFGDGVHVAYGQVNGTFGPEFIAYTASFTTGTGWSSQGTTPRQLGDVDGDGRADIIGFGSSTVRVSLSQNPITGTSDSETLTGTPGRDFITGLAGDDNLTGSAGWDTLDGGAGNDTLDGGTGNDSLFGGAGNDVYIVDSVGDTVWENPSEGNDEVRTSLTSYALSANFEDLTYTGPATFAGMGNELDNRITGGTGNDTLNGGAGNDSLVGGAGNDSMVGGAGNDVFFVDEAGDVVVEYTGEGTDEIRTTLATYALADTLENLTFIGSGAFAGTGNIAANLLQGGDGNDTLDGGTGTDTLVGGIGNDTYIVDDAGDVVTELAGQGTDTVRTALTSYTLVANVENLVYTGTAAFTGIGNTGNNAITGGAGNDSLNGDAGNDTLDGGAGADSLVGGTGNDTFIVDDVGDVIVELAGQGTDTVRTSLSSYTLGANVENLVVTGSGPITFTGNALNNSLIGGTGADMLTGLDGNDTLNGGAGVDTLIGGTGNDTYVIDNIGDVLVELPGEGTDTVQSSISHTLLTDFENLTLTGSAALAGTGNTVNNLLTGNGAANLLTGLEGDDTLNGGGGADTLVGGIGNDLYVVDNAGDVVTELVGEGIDTVNASINWTLGANIENLTLTGSAAISATGNELNNVLTGNSGANLLDGGLGADSMAGGAGNDVYLVDDAGDVVTELTGQGSDEVRTSLSSYLLGANVEVLTYTGTGDFAGTGNALDNLLTGGLGNDTLSGGDGADTLDGGAGSNLLIGGSGNDVYLVGALGDQVVELSGEGIDEVRTALTSYTLTDGVETLTYTGVAAFAGTGNALDNLIAGGAGADTLDGGFGADTLIGGLGDDVYVVDSVGDTVIEGTDAGIDEVRTTLSAFTLGDTVERLVFQGGGDASGVGNGLDNWLAGNVGNDTLDGGAGNDTLLGGLGNDVLTGGSGADLFAFAAGDGLDSITDFDAAQGDRIGLAAGQAYSVDTNANGDAVIVYGTGDIVTLAGIQPAAVSSAWFVTL
ncbi:beta strand repeat-containing protein [Azospirillum palustre]